LTMVTKTPLHLKVSQLRPGVDYADEVGGEAMATRTFNEPSTLSLETGRAGWVVTELRKLPSGEFAPNCGRLIRSEFSPSVMPCCWDEC